MSTPPRRPSRLPESPASPTAVSPPRRPWVPRAPTPEEAEATIARTALELGLPEGLVAGWLWLGGEIGPRARRSHGARLGEQR